MEDSADSLQVYNKLRVDIKINIIAKWNKVAL